ncbi:SDR family oxidoreductase [Lederbergia citri]|uniref:SDR family oxidoreductase n=1 Tax=Lederbergia citri TaxID=2833580 RepID=UPI002277A6E1|nr:SDR family oxidoreductase [Lederbergia citri]
MPRIYSYRTWLQEKEKPIHVEKEILELHATGKICTPDDIANLALFLASDNVDKMTGESIVLDGGLSNRLYHSDDF